MRKQDYCINLNTIAFAITPLQIHKLSPIPAHRRFLQWKGKALLLQLCCCGFLCQKSRLSESWVLQNWRSRMVEEVAHWKVNAWFSHGQMVFKCTEILNWLYSILASLQAEFKRSVFHFCQGDHEAGCTHSPLTPSHRTRENRSISFHRAPVWHPLGHW